MPAPARDINYSRLDGAVIEALHLVSVFEFKRPPPLTPPHRSQELAGGGEPREPAPLTDGRPRKSCQSPDPRSLSGFLFLIARRSLRSPPPTRLRVVGRGWGWGVMARDLRYCETGNCVRTR